MLSDRHKQLRALAQGVYAPHLMRLPVFQLHAGAMAWVWLSPGPAELAPDDGGVQILAVCGRDVWDALPRRTAWAEDGWDETVVNGGLVRYRCDSFEGIERRLVALDDAALYDYGRAEVLRDPGGHYARRIAPLDARNPEIRKQRIEGKLDLLIRRSRALRWAAAHQDALALAQLGLELIRMTLKVAALLDAVPFDPRRRLLNAATVGPLGARIEPRVRGLMQRLGELGAFEHAQDFRQAALLPELDDVIQMLAEEAVNQGFRMCLDRPDQRHIES